MLTVKFSFVSSIFFVIFFISSSSLISEYFSFKLTNSSSVSTSVLSKSKLDIFLVLSLVISSNILLSISFSYSFVPFMMDIHLLMLSYFVLRLVSIIDSTSLILIV